MGLKEGNHVHCSRVFKGIVFATLVAKFLGFWLILGDGYCFVVCSVMEEGLHGNGCRVETSPGEMEVVARRACFSGSLLCCLV